MKFAFMTSVFPKLKLPELIAKAKEYACQGIECRPEWKQAHGVELESSPATRQAARKAMRAAGLEFCCLSPSTNFNAPSKAERDAQLENLRKYIVLAGETGIPRIRVFADPIPNAGGGARAASYRVQAEYLAEGARAAKQAGVTICLETHGTFRAFDAGEVLYHAAYPPALRVNWHLAHCLLHGEDVDEAYRHVKGLVAHVHIAFEEKEMPHLERQMELLLAEGYGGYFAIEVINPPNSDETMTAQAKRWREMRAKLGF